MKILIRGSNDVASAVAHLLFKEGYAVVMHDAPQPVTARRLMSFTDAIYDGSFTLDGVEARLFDVPHLTETLAAHKVIPVVVEDFSDLLERLRPEMLIDARMRKHAQPETQRGLAPVVIGLGPNFIAGQTVDVGIETGWDALGQIVRAGATKPLQGEPREIAGHARDRYVYAPCAGIFRTQKQIGDKVQQGEEVARIDATPLYAPIGGTLRGLTRDNIRVTEKTKTVEIDPRLTGAQISGIGERPAKIAQGVLRAIAVPTGS